MPEEAVIPESRLVIKGLNPDAEVDPARFPSPRLEPEVNALRSELKKSDEEPAGNTEDPFENRPAVNEDKPVKDPPPRLCKILPS